TPMSLPPSRKPSAGQRRYCCCLLSLLFFCCVMIPSDDTKHTTCSDNHGIRPPTPEQYLTPLQQKEVCIRHLRARLRENVEILQHRDSEITEMRTQLCRMQEDWIEEECHRVEAQLALKEARREIQHLHEVVETVRSNLGTPEKSPHNQKPYISPQGPRPVKSRSCGCSPASTLNRSTTYTRLSSEGLHLDRNGNVPGPDLRAAARAEGGRTHLLLEAALLSEQNPVDGPVEMTIMPTVAQTCQPKPVSLYSLERQGSVTGLEKEEAVEVEGEIVVEGEEGEEGAPQRNFWSRYFLVDLLAVAMPVVPTVAWLCHGAPREVMPVYHIGSLLRGCCAVALHSLRRRGCGRGHEPTSMNGATDI
uniref:Syntaphilin n=1 Tax=Oncorhynchus kisutch TaxID=8019 RepID=A0A8C7E0J7_ONCKI